MEDELAMNRVERGVVKRETVRIAAHRLHTVAHVVALGALACNMQPFE